MIDVASPELCGMLFKLSGWHDAKDKWWPQIHDPLTDTYRGYRIKENHIGRNGEFPAYDLGYLLRKLQSAERTISLDYHSPSQPTKTDLKGWAGKYTASTADMPQYQYPIADTPANALCKLAIELFKRDVLKSLSK